MRIKRNCQHADTQRYRMQQLTMQARRSTHIQTHVCSNFSVRSKGHSSGKLEYTGGKNDNPPTLPYRRNYIFLQVKRNFLIKWKTQKMKRTNNTRVYMYVYFCVCQCAATLQRFRANKNAPGKWCSINICVALRDNGLVCEFFKIPSFQCAILVFSQCTDRVAGGFFLSQRSERTYIRFFVATAHHIRMCVFVSHMCLRWMPVTKVTVDWLCHCCWFFDFCSSNYLSHFSFLQLIPLLPLLLLLFLLSLPMLSNKAARS